MRVLKVLGLFSILAALNIATVCVFLSAIPARAGLTEPGPVCLQGDINNDGSRNLADAIRLLNFLFSEGPEPVACAQDEPMDVAAEMEKALGKFFPRSNDYYFVEVSIDPEETEAILEVEEGRVFVLQGVFSAVPAERELLRDDDLLPSLAGIVSWGRVPFLPGEEFKIKNTYTGAALEFTVFGYFTDYEDPEK